MFKRILIAFIILLIITGVVFGQEQPRAKNAMSLSFGFIGSELSYERMFNRHFSVLADVSYTTLLLFDMFTASAKARVYPFGKTFYLDVGLGYVYGRGVFGGVGNLVLGIFTLGYYWAITGEDPFARTSGFLVQPSLGWKIDIGKQDHFLLPISMGVDIKIAELSDFLPFIRIGVGYAF